MGASINNTRGFTLVEISIVMIIIGLLIGGTFGGMKLVENMQVNRTVQDLKSINSAALTFRDTYGRLPGDLVNPAARLPSCTDAPCATGGNGDRTLGASYTAVSVPALTDTDERFVFWHHLQAADLVSLQMKNSLDMNFGEGTPASPIGGGYRLIGRLTSLYNQSVPSRHPILISDNFNAVYSSTPPQSSESIKCALGASIDRKIDDGRPLVGRVVQYGYCPTPPLDATSVYRDDGGSGILWFIGGF